MSYTVKNASELSSILAKAIKAEIVRETGYPAEIVDIVVNNYDLENRGLSQMVAEIYQIIKSVVGE